MKYKNIPYSVVTAQLGRQAHPDVLANILAQEPVRRTLERDRDGRTDINVLLGNKVILVSGQIHSIDPLTGREIGKLIREKVEEVGYNDKDGYGLRYDPAFE